MKMKRYFVMFQGGFTVIRELLIKGAFCKSIVLLLYYYCKFIVKLLLAVLVYMQTVAVWKNKACDYIYLKKIIIL